MSQNISLVSIIIPAYNAQKYIEEAIESVINQTYIHWELIVIDDGSTDNTGSLIASFRDSRIVVITQDNQGVSSARNRGLDIAKGKYITFLDADDVLPNNSILYRINYLEYHSNIDVLHGIISIRDEELRYETKVYAPFECDNILKKSLHLNECMSFNPCYMIRREKLKGVSFREGMHNAEDILFFITLYLNNIQLASIPKIIYHYRVTKNSASNNMVQLKEGYLELLYTLDRFTTISYRDTFIMRLKISKIFLSSNVRNKNFNMILDLISIFRR